MPSSVLYASPLSFQNKCVPYWPEVGTQRVYGLYSVTNCEEHDTAEYKLRTLQISPLDNVSVPGPCTPQEPLLRLAPSSGRVGQGRGVEAAGTLTLCPWPRGTWFGRYGTTST